MQNHLILLIALLACLGSVSTALHMPHFSSSTSMRMISNSISQQQEKKHLHVEIVPSAILSVSSSCFHIL